MGGIALDLGTGRRFFAIQELDLGPTSTVVARPGDPEARVQVRWETATGGLIQAEADRRLPLAGDQRLVIQVDDGEQTTSYLVGILPDDMPPLEWSGGSTDHFLFLAARDYTLDGQPAPYAPMLIITDGHGTPVWWKRTLVAGFDFRVSEDGLFTVNTVFDAEEGFLTHVIDPTTGEVLRTVGPGGPAHWVDRRVDAHEFQLRADGSFFRTITGDGTGDLGAIGGPAEAELWHSGAELVDPAGALVARWTTEDRIDYASLPQEVLDSEADPGPWRYGHVNSIQDLGEEWLLSLRSPNQVVWVDPATGAIRRRLGGVGSDYAFVDDPRGGFYGQHSARIFEPDRITLFDNGTNFFSPPTGDVRAVEYALDDAAGTATLVWEYALEGAGGTDFAGLVQRLDDGCTLIGWGSTQLQGGERAPSLTLLDPAHRRVADLRLPLGMYTYRAYAFDGDPVAGRWEPGTP